MIRSTTFGIRGRRNRFYFLFLKIFVLSKGWMEWRPRGFANLVTLQGVRRSRMAAKSLSFPLSRLPGLRKESIYLSFGIVERCFLNSTYVRMLMRGTSTKQYYFCWMLSRRHLLPHPRPTTTKCARRLPAFRGAGTFVWVVLSKNMGTTRARERMPCSKV